MGAPMKLGPLGYYRWFVRDYRANRKVQRMSYVSRGLYRELLDEEWLEGPLPTDLPSLADICGCPLKVMEKSWPEIAACFALADGRLVNDKLECMRTDQDRTRIKRVLSGRLGGIAKQTVANAKHLLEDEKPVEQVLNNENSLLNDETDLPYSNRSSNSSSRLLADAKGEPIPPEIVASWVLDDLQLSGMSLRLVLDDICRMALNAGTSADELRGSLVNSWQGYEEAKPRLSYTVGAQKFFGEGVWRNRDGWPWKEGFAPASRPIEPAKPVHEYKSNAIPMSEIRAMAKAGAQ